MDKTGLNLNLPIAFVDVVLLSLVEDELKVLLCKRKEEPLKGKWALPGVMVNPESDENIEQAALRALKFKGQIGNGYVEQLEGFSGWDRDPRGFSISYAHLCVMSSDQINLGNDGFIKLVCVEDALGMQLAFDHIKILESGVARLRSKVSYSSLPAHLLPAQFTLAQLQKAYEVLLETKLDKSAFRKKIAEMGFVRAVNGAMKHGANRPAQCYEINKNIPLALFRRTLA